MPSGGADLAQAALERTYVRWAHVRSEDPMVYVRKALVNQQRDWWRRRQRRPEWPAATVPDVAGPEDHAAGHAQRDVMRAALAQLTRRERHVVVLRYYADLADPEIAAEVGIAVGTVKSTSARALRKLRAALGAAGGGMPPPDPAEGLDAAASATVAPASETPATATPASAGPAKAGSAKPGRYAASLPTKNLPTRTLPTKSLPTRGEA